MPVLQILMIDMLHSMLWLNNNQQSVTTYPKIFTIASVDNFDMLQSYAAVCFGDQQWSYHKQLCSLYNLIPISVTMNRM